MSPTAVGIPPEHRAAAAVWTTLCSSAPGWDAASMGAAVALALAELRPDVAARLRLFLVWGDTAASDQDVARALADLYDRLQP